MKASLPIGFSQPWHIKQSSCHVEPPYSNIRDPVRGSRRELEMAPLHVCHFRLCFTVTGSWKECDNIHCDGWTCSDCSDISSFHTSLTSCDKAGVLFSMQYNSETYSSADWALIDFFNALIFASVWIFSGFLWLIHIQTLNNHQRITWKSVHVSTRM